MQQPRFPHPHPACLLSPGLLQKPAYFRAILEKTFIFSLTPREWNKSQVDGQTDQQWFPPDLSYFQLELLPNGAGFWVQAELVKSEGAQGEDDLQKPPRNS